MQRIFTLLAYFFVFANGFAQRYSFISYTPKEGLINSRVRNIFQDSKGRMFFLTHVGLSIYDGTKFDNYTSSNGLGSDIVNDVYEVAPDSFLVATNTNRLNTLVNGKISFYKTTDGFSPVVNHFFKSTNGNLYVIADEGLFILKSRKFIPIPLFKDSLLLQTLYLGNIHEWKQFLLLSTWQGKENLIIYDTSQRKVTDVFEGASIVNIVSAGNDSDIFISTNDGILILDKQKLSKGKILLKRTQGVNEKIYSAFQGILFDKNNTEWLYNNNSIAKKISGDAYQVFGYRQGLEANNISSLFFDREGILWIATDGSGIMKLTNTDVSLINSLNGDDRSNITALQCAGDTIWMYDTKNRVICMEKKKVNIFIQNKIQRVRNIFLSGNKVWLHNEKNVYSIEEKDHAGSWEHPQLIYSLSESDGSFGKAAPDPFGGFHFSYKKDTVNFILTITAQHKIFLVHTDGFIDELLCDRHQRLWAITRNNNLLVFALHPDDNKNYLTLLHNYKKEFPAVNPRSFTIDNNDDLWIGTRDEGIYFLQMENLQLKSFLQLSAKDGLTDNFIYSIACDKKNNIWAGTQNGLDKISFQNRKYIIENTSRINNIFETVLDVKIDPSGIVWALCNLGNIIKVSPTLRKHKLDSIPLFITGIKVNGTPAEIKNPNFNYKQSSLSFSVAAPSFIDEHSVLYSYLLEGSNNNNWSLSSNISVFNFLNLSPGEYHLKIKASFPGKMYPEQIVAYSFTILPPWWKTWWFRIPAGLLVIGSLIFVLRFYYQRKLEKQKITLEKQQAIEKERTRIATDMHDDLGAGLSRIKFLSETIGIKKQKDEPVEEDISKIREYSHEMIDKMGEIVWALNEKNDSISDLLGYTRAYAVEYLSQNDISPVVEMPENIPSNFVSGEFRRNFFLSVKEALHNIVKHSRAKHVYIKISVSKKLEIIIEDDGTGFDKNNLRPNSNGLTNMEKRMKDLEGKFEIESNNGTIVRLTAPLPA